MTPESKEAALAAIVSTISANDRFVIASHARPDGDAVGSSLAMAFALRDLGKQVRVVSADPAIPPLQVFPGMAEIEIGPVVEGDYDVAIIMECGDLGRTGISGLDRGLLVNIDHHQGNTLYGTVNWFDVSAAACGEMVFDVVQALGVPLSREIALHVYLAILTDTGSFHFSAISPRTFDICRQAIEAGVDPVWTARAVFDSNTMGRLKLFGAVLNGMQVEAKGRLAVIAVDHEMARAAGGTYDDTEGLINLPLTVGAIQAVIFFKQVASNEYRVSFRSKGAIDVAAVARGFGGGGHKNASGCSVTGPIETLQPTLVALVERAIDLAHVPPAR